MKNPTDKNPTVRRRIYSAEKARQGEIILRKPWQRAIFFAGLAGSVLLLIAHLIVAP